MIYDDKYFNYKHLYKSRHTDLNKKKNLLISHKNKFMNKY